MHTHTKRFLAWPLLCAFSLCLALLLTSNGNPQTRRTIAASQAWPTASPESQGIDSAALAELINDLRQRAVPIHSLLIVRNGKLVTEAYFHPYDGQTPHDIASVTKPITTTLIGLAIAQGKLKSVNEPLLAVFPKRKIAQIDERKQRVTIEHLLTMSSGLGCKAQPGEPTLWEMLSAPDNLQFMLDSPMLSEPGSQYVYCSGGMHVLSAVIGQTTGLSAEAFARKHLFAPLGIQQWIWPQDPQGVSHGFGNLHLLPRDMARLGQLFLQDGVWNGKQIVPAAWIKEATRSHIKTGGAGSSDYGYGWRIPAAGNPAAFEASGRGGQMISIWPSKNAVVVLTGGGYNTGEIIKKLLPAFTSAQALPENAKALAQLNTALSAARQAPVPQTAAPLPARAQTIAGKSYVFTPNWLGLHSLSLTFTSNDTATARLTFQPALKQYQFGLSAKVRGANTITETRPVGLTGVARISSGGVMNLPVALKGGWENEQTFWLEYDEIANTNTYRLRLTFTGEGVNVQAKERTGLFDETFTGRIAARNP